MAPAKSPPFTNGLKFGEALETQFLREALVWMAGERLDGKGSSVPITMHCAWGAALYLDAYIQSLREFRTSRRLEIANDTEAANLLAQASILAEYLAGCARSERVGNDDGCHWEGVLYDSALITHSLIEFMAYVQRSDRVQGTAQVETNLRNTARKIPDIASRAMLWMHARVRDWEEVRYPAGIQDLGTTLRAVVAFRRQRTHLKVLWQEDNGLDKLGNSLLDRLIGALQASDQTSTPGARSDDPLPIAHSLIAIVEFAKHTSAERRATITLLLSEWMRRLDASQAGGRWGIANETAITLEAYLAVSELLTATEDGARRYRPNEAVVFKAVRWLVDANQRFSDGSVLHVFTYTAFFVLALQRLLATTCLSILKMDMLTCYDEIVWSQTSSESMEREARFRLADELTSLEETIRRYWVWRVISKLALALATLGVWVVIATLAHWVYMVPVNHEPVLPPSSYTAFFSSLSLTLAAIVALWKAQDLLLIPHLRKARSIMPKSSILREN